MCCLVGQDRPFWGRHRVSFFNYNFRALIPLTRILVIGKIEPVYPGNIIIAESELNFMNDIQPNIKEKETAQVTFWLGLQLEKMDHFDLSYDLYEAAAGIDPSHTEVVERLNSLKARISSSSRYDYLIRNKIVTTNQLQEALAIAKKMNKSIEFVLVERFGINKDNVGKSLSQYFGCPFRDFDEEFPIPFELTG